MLLRRDRPNWPRPVRLPNWYVPLGAALAVFNFILLIFGGFIYSGGFLGITGYGYGWDKTRVGLLVLAGRVHPVPVAPPRAGQDPGEAARGGSADARGGARRIPRARRTGADARPSCGSARRALGRRHQRELVAGDGRR